jgi:murein DD-endopeptidase MepM/ murein hydrolase activator NlpD
VSDAEAAAIENGVRKALSVRQRQEGAMLQLNFAGHYGQRGLDRVVVDPISGAKVTLTRSALSLPAAATIIAASAAPTAPTPPAEAPKPTPQVAADPAPVAAPVAAPAAAPAVPAVAPQAVAKLAPADPVPLEPTAAAAAPAPAPAAKPASTGGAAPAVTATPPSLIGRYAPTPGFAKATGVADADVAQAMRVAGVPRSVADEIKDAIKLHPELKRANLAGSRFEVVYDPSYDANAGFSLAAFNVGGRDHRLWRFQPQSAPGGYFTDEGERLAGIVLRSPMPGIEINSGFGMRKHPVFRVAKMHWGVDFPAPHGAPIIAAADGVITAAKRYGNYGLYMHIDHGEGVATTYGHMSSFAPGMKPGVKVKAGDVIAHIGRTGVATGPHLYFEVVIGERRVDPEPLIAEGAHRLVGSDLVAFERVKLQTGVTEVASESRN